jgi:hypothetical protein
VSSGPIAGAFFERSGDEKLEDEMDTRKKLEATAVKIGRPWAKRIGPPAGSPKQRGLQRKSFSNYRSRSRLWQINSRTAESV